MVIVDAGSPASNSEIALDVMGRAYQALAMLHVLANPGQHTDRTTAICQCVSDQSERNAELLSAGPEGRTALEAAISRVRTLMYGIQAEISAMIVLRQRPIP